MGLMGVVRCRACGGSMCWVKTRAGKMMPLDPVPNPAGNVVIEDGLARVLRKSEPRETLAGPLIIYMPHHATCPNWPSKRGTG